MTAGDSEPGGMGAPGDKSQGPSRSKDLPAIHGWGWCGSPRAVQEGKENVAVTFLNLPHAPSCP